MDSQDKLQSCVQSYNQLVKNEVSYDIRLFDGYEIADCSLKFPVKACRHLTGIHKLGLGNIGRTAEDFFNKALCGAVTFEDACRSNFLINDDIPPEGTGTQTTQDWKKEKEDEARQLGTMTKSQFVGRLSALENIHDTICKTISGLQKSSPDIELKIYKWNRDCESRYRPHGSAIAADFLLEFEDTSKTEKPLTAFFIRQTEDGAYVGESIFTSDYTFSEDLPTEGRKRVSEVTLLSFLEKGSYLLLAGNKNS